MSHKAGASFFDRKREWSRRKDEILGCYLAAYLPKIMTLRKPVLIVDGFAGAGRFADGEKGSPLIICECIERILAKRLKSPQPVNLVCIERIPKLFRSLEENLKPFTFASAKPGLFSDYADRISQATKTKSVFLYVDPFTVEGLVWSELDSIFAGLDFGNSVEILLNLNSPSFIRRGLSALKTQLDGMEDESGDPVDAESQDDPLIERLDAVAGGCWWQDLITRKLPYPEVVTEFTHKYCQQMNARFNAVVFHPIKEAPHHTTPKYFLVFGTRHVDGLVLMNDEMVKSGRILADMAKPKMPTLFETRSEELIPDLDRLPGLILQIASTPIKRKGIINGVIRQAFCDFHTTEIRGCIKALLKSKRLQSETGKVEEVLIWATQQ